MKAKVYIDGEAGTTGLEIRARLEGRRDLEIIELKERRRDVEARREALNEADVSILCLPDDAAREAVALIERPTARVIDASTAHRTAPGWVYGFPELTAPQRETIAEATRVSNPGCYPTGALGLLRPLVASGLVPAEWPVTINAVSGYSGGGKAMIAEFEDKASEAYVETPFRTYGLTLEHKHVEEMRVHAGLAHRPLFAPAVARYRQGMLVDVPLQLWALPGAPTVADLAAVLEAAYEGQHFVEVVGPEACAGIKTLDPEGLNGTNHLRLYVFGNEGQGQVRLVALLDNLGKGASGQAVQCLNIMLGRDEREGI